MSIQNSHRIYYEISKFWDQNLLENAEDEERIASIVVSIPKEAKTVLEVGCGNGAIINNLHKLEQSFDRLVGVDISESALKYVNTEKYLQNINSLTFDDNSFDCVIASEVIEHLTYDDLKSGTKELERVSKEWIIISVPNDDDLEVDARMCNRCYCWFNPNYHMNSYNRQRLAFVFDEFKLIEVKEIGPQIRRTKYSKLGKLIYHYRKNPIPKIGICPQCGFNFSNWEGRGAKPSSNNLLYKKSFAIFNILLRSIVSKKYQKARWLLAIYKKQK